LKKDFLKLWNTFFKKYYGKRLSIFSSFQKILFKFQKNIFIFCIKNKGTNFLISEEKSEIF